MKNIIKTTALLFTFSILLFQSYFASAQVPQTINYQAIARNSSGTIMANQSVSVEIRILQGSSTGTQVCDETFATSTNDFGLINLQIGSQNPTAFDTINWAAGSYWIEVSLDGTLFGTSQLISVPYALHAATTDSLVNFSETDPVYTGSIAAGITGLDTAYWNNKLDAELDGDSTNELQTISRTGLNVTLSNGGGTYTDSVNVYTAGEGIDISGNVVSANSNSILPPGIIMPYAGPVSTIPAGWLLCDGSEISRTTYANLYNIIGISYGIGNATTTFNLPDMRGRFLRGVDHGAGNDPDATLRTGFNGGNTGDTVATYQDDAFQGHRHSMPETPRFGAGGSWNPYSPAQTSQSITGDPVSDATNGTPRTTSETRPKNINVNYIIKY